MKALPSIIHQAIYRYVHPLIYFSYEPHHQETEQQTETETSDAANTTLITGLKYNRFPRAALSHYKHQD